MIHINHLTTLWYTPYSTVHKTSARNCWRRLVATIMAMVDNDNCDEFRGHGGLEGGGEKDGCLGGESKLLWSATELALEGGRHQGG